MFGNYIIHGRSLSLTEPNAPSFIKGSSRVWSAAVPAIFFTTHARDDGALQDQVPGPRVR